MKFFKFEFFVWLLFILVCSLVITVRVHSGDILNTVAVCYDIGYDTGRSLGKSCGDRALLNQFKEIAYEQSPCTFIFKQRLAWSTGFDDGWRDGYVGTRANYSNTWRKEVNE